MAFTSISCFCSIVSSEFDASWAWIRSENRFQLRLPMSPLNCALFRSYRFYIAVMFDSIRLF